MCCWIMSPFYMIFAVFIFLLVVTDDYTSILHRYKDIKPQRCFQPMLRAKNLLRMPSVTWPVGGGQNDYIFGVSDAILPVHYTTSMRLRWRLRAVYRWEFYTGAFLTENFYPFLGPIFDFGGIFQRLDINFKFSTPKKVHPCVRPRRLSHRA